METLPSLEEFKEQSKKFDIIAVRAEFTADSETPLSAYAKLSKKKPSFLFESVVGGEQVSRFSFVGFNPKKIISCRQSETVIFENGKELKKIPTPNDPLSIVDEENNKCTVTLKCNYNLISQIKEFEEFVNNNNFNNDKINIIMSLIWINMAPLHDYPLSAFLFNFGKYNLYNYNQKITNQ